MKTKLNNILNANTWLFIELVIITVVAWAVFEPAIVNLYYRSLPLGYDSSQLLYAETEVNGSWNEVVDGVPQDPYEMTEKRLDKIMRQLTSVEGEMLFAPTLFAGAFAAVLLLNLLAAVVPAWWSLRKPIVESMMEKR